MIFIYAVAWIWIPVFVCYFLFFHNPLARFISLVMCAVLFVLPMIFHAVDKWEDKH